MIKQSRGEICLHPTQQPYHVALATPVGLLHGHEGVDVVRASAADAVTGAAQSARRQDPFVRPIEFVYSLDLYFARFTRRVTEVHTCSVRIQSAIDDERLETDDE